MKAVHFFWFSYTVLAMDIASQNSAIIRLSVLQLEEQQILPHTLLTGCEQVSGFLAVETE